MSRLEPKILWEPSPEFIRNSNMFKYAEWLKANYGKDFGLSEDAKANVKAYNSMWRWSVESLEEFWETVWKYFNIISHTPYTKVLESRTMPGARWFTGATVNFAENVLRHAEAKRDEEAIVYVREDGLRRSMSWGELEREVAAASQWLREVAGVRKGDRVAAYITQVPEGVVALLAAASVGAIWVAVG
ncbi:MAG: AMP-binding protein, partial [Acidilobus sp.]|nr:AMP-binding protein [Acidilobus sp.]